MQTRRKGVFAFGKQTAKGTPLANPTFAVPKITGGIGPAGDRSELPLTAEGAQRWGNFKNRARGEGTVTVLAHPEALGLLLYEVCGAQAVVGAAAPYEHTFTIAEDIPIDNPLTVWDMVGGDWWRYADCYVSRLTARAASGDLVRVEMQLISFDFGPVAAPTYTLVTPSPRYKFIGSTILLEADAAAPVEVTNAESVEVTINRALEVRYGSSLVPVEIGSVERQIDFSVGLVFSESGNNQGWDYLKAAHLGGVAGTGPDQDFVNGSFEASFGRHPVSAGRELTVASNGQNWNYDVARPESDPGGGSLEFDVAGPVVRPAAGGSEITITLANETAGAY